jgi:uncharacterized protein (TIGR01777 family)
VAQAWERAATPVREKGVRLVHPRIAIVYGNGGGALLPLARVFKLGLGGKLGSGAQWVSWIHRDDLCRLLLFCVENDGLTGPVNASAPAPVTNAEFTRTLARLVHRPAFFAVPAFVLRTLLGGFSSELLESKRVLPQRALEAGFTFEYPTLEPALRSAL